jgi:hypothetical protein
MTAKWIQVNLFGGCFVICLLYPPKGLESEKNGKKIEHKGCIMSLKKLVQK